MAINIHDLEEAAATIWDDVCRNIDVVLKECELHGLADILNVPNPSVEARLTALRIFEGVCSTIISALESSAEQQRSAEHHSTIRIMINAQQQMLNLRLLLNAAKSGDSKEFDEAKAKLSGQAKH
jgi:hypothetical protein